MFGFKKLFGFAALAAAAMIWGSAAEATPLSFNLQTSLYNYSWTMDSKPAVFAFVGVDTATFDFTGQAIGSSTALPPGELFFYSSALNGGLSLYDPTSNSVLFNLLGDVIYTNGETAPHFAPGLFAVASGTLTVANVAATPIPATLPLFASALGGLGIVSWRRKRTS